MPETQFQDTKTAAAFVMAGSAIFTVRSQKTDTRYTFKVREKETKDGKGTVHFVNLLTGPENTSDYTYLGMIRDGEFKLTKASKLAATSGPVVAFGYVYQGLMAGALQGVDIFHAGKCGRCGRVLTVPESIQAGIGPDCAGKM